MYILPVSGKDAAQEYECPEGVVSCQAMIDGALRTWKEFVPGSCTGGAPAPLVLSLHGGNSGRGRRLHCAEHRNAWVTVAQQYGFIAVFPQSLTEEISWNPWNLYGEADGMKDDVRYLDQLIELLCEKYPIDRSRIYLHGQSFGDVMACCYLLQRPERFAAAALLSGPSAASAFVREDGSFRFGGECACPVVRTHGSEDLLIPMGKWMHVSEGKDAGARYDPARGLLAEAGGRPTEELRQMKMELQQLVNLQLWRHCNGCGPLPRLSVRGNYNVITYPGGADFHYYVVEGGGHSTSLDMADFVWRYFFSGFRRVDGAVVRVPPAASFEPDRGALALTRGAELAYVDQELVRLPRHVSEQDGALYVTVPSLTALFPQLSAQPLFDGRGVLLRAGGHCLQLAAGSRAAVWDDSLRWLDRTLWSGGELLLPVAGVAKCFWNMHCACAYHTMYLSGQEGTLSYDMSYIIQTLLGVRPALSPGDCREMERRILAGQGLELPQCT